MTETPYLPQETIGPIGVAAVSGIPDGAYWGYQTATKMVTKWVVVGGAKITAAIPMVYLSLAPRLEKELSCSVMTGQKVEHTEVAGTDGSASSFTSQISPQELLEEPRQNSSIHTYLLVTAAGLNPIHGVKVVGNMEITKPPTSQHGTFAAVSISSEWLGWMMFTSSIATCCSTQTGYTEMVENSSGCFPVSIGITAFGDWWGRITGPVMVNTSTFTNTVTLLDGAHTIESRRDGKGYLVTINTGDNLIPENQHCCTEIYASDRDVDSHGKEASSCPCKCSCGEEIPVIVDDSAVQTKKDEVVVCQPP